MVKDLNELKEVAGMWSVKAQNEICTQLKKFMSEHDASAEKIAEILGWNVKKVNAILEGNADLRLSDLATLMVATNQVAHIVPTTESPITYGSIPDEQSTDEEDEETDDFGDKIPSWDKKEVEKPTKKEPVNKESKDERFGICISDNPEAAEFLGKMMSVLQKTGILDVLSDVKSKIKK